MCKISSQASQPNISCLSCYPHLSPVLRKIWISSTLSYKIFCEYSPFCSTINPTPLTPVFLPQTSTSTRTPPSTHFLKYLPLYLVTLLNTYQMPLSLISSCHTYDYVTLQYFLSLQLYKFHSILPFRPFLKNNTLFFFNYILNSTQYVWPLDWLPCKSSANTAGINIFHITGTCMFPVQLIQTHIQVLDKQGLRLQSCQTVT